MASVAKCWRQKSRISLSRGVVLSRSTFHLVLFVFGFLLPCFLFDSTTSWRIKIHIQMPASTLLYESDRFSSARHCRTATTAWSAEENKQTIVDRVLRRQLSPSSVRYANNLQAAVKGAGNSGGTKISKLGANYRLWGPSTQRESRRWKSRGKDVRSWAPPQRRSEIGLGVDPHPRNWTISLTWQAALSVILHSFSNFTRSPTSRYRAFPFIPLPIQFSV